MIPRYSRPAMNALWTEEAKLARWLEVELAVCRAWAAAEVIPAADLAEIEAKAGFSVERTQELERVTNHDVVAFLTDVNERVGPASRWIHYGMTSSDVLDTGLALAIRRSGELLLAGQAALTATLRDLALEHRDTLCVGRTHGIHAEPTTFGLKLAGHALESRRNEERLRDALAGASVGTLSGAVGTYAMLEPAIEAAVLAELGIGGEPIPTQVVARDRHAQLVCTMAVAASSLDRLATELRHLQRTELREAEEAFTVGQKGSSAMPHKRNPITAERISGIARVVRGHAVAALEDVALWHERDISHSSVERIILPDAFLALDYMLHKARTLMEGLVVREDRMRAVLESSHGLVFSQRVLLGLVERGLTREEAYALVQRNALRAWDEERPLGDLLAEDDEVTAVIPAAEVAALLDPAWYTRHVPELMERVAGL
ncbi:adenylosuccinate lyase [Miltoncostaea oceani]|uniref:adenylosuccinate lyase n=1 Tax=Miltoncostaea oceani TaxID=2843216 RepID=UPI002484BD97|nr:adenylosuccinate lyase [Miltoncostaea oceani]